MSNALPLTIPDLVCVLDLDPNGNETKTDLETLSQDVLHVLLELLGSNPDDPERGVGIDMFLSGTVDDLAKATRAVETQLEADDRIDTVSANLVQQADGSFVLHIEIGVDGSIIGLQYGYTTNGGLVPLAPVGG